MGYRLGLDPYNLFSHVPVLFGTLKRFDGGPYGVFASDRGASGTVEFDLKVDYFGYIDGGVGRCKE